MQRVMAREAEAEREKRGNIIKSEGEVIASNNLAKAAITLHKVPGAMQLRTLQTINDISSDPSQKFIFFPMELTEIFKK
jgi:regulator of protease activity HflC (stomatin/prohibitin superfamily)